MQIWTQNGNKISTTYPLPVHSHFFYISEIMRFFVEYLHSGSGWRLTDKLEQLRAANLA